MRLGKEEHRVGLQPHSLRGWPCFTAQHAVRECQLTKTKLTPFPLKPASPLDKNAFVAKTFFQEQHRSSYIKIWTPSDLFRYERFSCAENCWSTLGLAGDGLLDPS